MLLQSGLCNEWWADSKECCCYLRNIQDLLSVGPTPYERRFGIPFSHTSDTVWSNARKSPYFCGRSISTASVWSKSLARYISRLCFLRVEHLERRHDGRRHCKEMEEMDAYELHARRLHAKEVLTPQRNGNFISPSQMEQSKSMGTTASENIHLNPGSFGTRRRTKNQMNCISNPTSRRSTRDDEEAKCDFWSITGELI